MRAIATCGSVVIISDNARFLCVDTETGEVDVLNAGQVQSILSRGGWNDNRDEQLEQSAIDLATGASKPGQLSQQSGEPALVR